MHISILTYISAVDNHSWFLCKRVVAREFPFLSELLASGGKLLLNNLGRLHVVKIT